MLRKVYRNVSFILFIIFLGLTVLQISGKSDLVTEMVAGYLRWIEQAPTIIVLIVFAVSSFLSSIIITIGFFSDKIGNKEILATKIFWSVFIVFFVMQFAPLVMRKLAV